METDTLYTQYIERLYKSVPSFQVVGSQAYHPGLRTMEEFDSFLGSPHRNYKTIHIAGTNGKGSVAHMMASVLQSQGLKVGLYTSPHLLDFRERIKVNSVMIPKQDVISFLDRCEHFIKDHQPSFFEISTAMAFDYFSDSKVDVAVIETGLGGRLDSTNIITPILSIITSIGFDHKDILGETLELIAKEKGGIIKPGIPAVVGEVPAEIEKVLESIASGKGSTLYLAKKEELPQYGCVPEKMDLRGEYQILNLKTVYSALHCLKDLISNDSAVADAICNAAAATGLRGRWEQLSEHPLTICDIAHNPHGMAPVMNQLSKLFEKGKFDKLFMVFGVMADKEIEAIAPLLPVRAYYFFTQASSPRALPSVRLSEILGRYGIKGETTASVKEAVLSCRKAAGFNDLIYIGGSSYVVAEALKIE